MGSLVGLLVHEVPPRFPVKLEKRRQCQPPIRAEAFPCDG
ncbi:hypothetical protein HMPREF0578_0331 [Mobiluncus mulieris 28-1]|nr:hypothetical protein HMPREF0578_0331 [Mobiluncus mulieris 28-1]